MTSRQDILESYRQQIKILAEKSEALRRGDGFYSFARVITFLSAMVILALALLDGGLSAWWTLPALLSFFAVMYIHEKKIAKAEQAKRRAAFYENGIKRISGEWQETGVKGEVFKDKEHFFSDDLNLFGENSLFQYICRCSTAFGRQRLAEWLKQPAAIPVVLQRQEAVRELAEIEKIREKYAELNDEEGKHLTIESFKSWAIDNTNLFNPILILTSYILAAFTLFSLGSWLFFGASGWLVIVSFFLNFLLLKFYAGKIEKITEGVNNIEQNLSQLSKVLEILEESSYRSPLMQELCKKLQTEGVTASQRIREIAKLIYNYENAKANMALQPLNFMLHINLRNASSIEKWRKTAGKNIPVWVDVAADFEALFSLAVYAHENPEYTMPIFREKVPYLLAEQIGHPLIQLEKAVKNDVSLGEDIKLMLISGSNMAGKSTFLRTVGVNIVLAQAGAPVFAKKMELSSFALGCSIQIQDNLAKGISHFYAEILRLKKLVDLVAQSSLPVMFFFDEILHGTNSSDRCNGASAVIRNLVKAGAVGFVTTHDLALTVIVDELSGSAVNVHFEDQFEDGKMSFDFKMKPGVVTRGNALQLMRSLGLDV